MKTCLFEHLQFCFNSTYACLIFFPVGITSCAVGVSYQKKNKREHDKVVLLVNTKLDTIEILFSKALIDSYISHYEFVSINNVLKEYNKS